MAKVPNLPRVSIIVPAHDSAAVIAQAVESVLAQTCADWELIVGDDASTDGTAAVVERLAPRATIVRGEVNRGPAAARNLALAHASGELVCLLDADDWWLPHYLERQVARYDAESARSGPPVGLVACDARIAEGGELLEHTYYEQFRQVEPLTLERLLRRNVVFVSALVPRAVGEQVGWFTEELYGTEDHDLWLRILERGYRAVVNREPLAVYRRTAGSISRNIARQGANNQRTYELALRRGRLTARQRRIARSELRYNRAMETVAAATQGGGRSGLVREAPTLAWVAATRPRHWRDWLAVLRS